MKRLTYIQSWFIAIVGVYLFVWLISAGLCLLIALASPEDWPIRLAALIGYFGGTALGVHSRTLLGSLYREDVPA